MDLSEQAILFRKVLQEEETKMFNINKFFVLFAGIIDLFFLTLILPIVVNDAVKFLADPMSGFAIMFVLLISLVTQIDRRSFYE